MSKVFLTLDMPIEKTRASARSTIEKLVAWHYSRIKEIDEGHHYYRRGEDVTDAMRKRHMHEISACTTVMEALQYMKAGDIQRAADLCSQIKEHLPTL